MENFNYSFTSREDDCLTDIIAYFVDQGLPEHFDNDAFDSVSDKILLGRVSAKLVLYIMNHSMKHALTNPMMSTCVSVV